MAQTVKHKEIYRAGDFKVRSDISGLTVMNSDCSVTWKGYKVPPEDFDPKHPQLIIYPKTDNIAVQNARPTSENDNDLPWGEGNKNDL